MSYPGKRLVDLAIAIPALIVFSPALSIIALLVLADVGRPILFKQLRPGLHGQPFWVYKFRTMKELRDSRGQPLADHERLTRFGIFLRATSLDELPELVNVLKGEMSLVGPRPLLLQYLRRYTADQMRRHDVRPGITGWSQVNGRNAITWEERFNFDVWYVEHQSLRLDVKILILTLWKVLQREGISQDGHVTMEEFMGTARTAEPSP